MKRANPAIWDEYRQLLSSQPANNRSPVPRSLVATRVRTNFDYVPPEQFLEDFREWVGRQGETGVYYLLTETTGDEETDFELCLDDLNVDILRSINPNAESVLTGKTYGWAIHIDHDGFVTAAGPDTLRELVEAFRENG